MCHLVLHCRALNCRLDLPHRVWQSKNVQRGTSRCRMRSERRPIKGPVKGLLRWGARVIRRQRRESEKGECNLLRCLIWPHEIIYHGFHGLPHCSLGSRPGSLARGGGRRRGRHRLADIGGLKAELWATILPPLLYQWRILRLLAVARNRKEDIPAPGPRTSHR